MQDVDSNAVVVLVGKSSTHRENHLEWIVRGTCEGMRLDLDLQATHYLAAWALPDERIDHSVSNRGVVELGFALGLTPMTHA